MKCRHCSTPLNKLLVNLDFSPPCNALLHKSQLDQPEIQYPLKVYVCKKCFLVQIDEVKSSKDIFNDQYTYFSSYSSSWLSHAKDYVEMMIDRFGLDTKSKVVEVASNDGYLLQYFTTHNIPVLGIEPTSNTAEVAKSKGINTLVEFFGTNLAKEEFKEENQKADLLLGNNVLAHVPDINDFVKGMGIALKSSGVITMEFPHLFNLLEQIQFDTIYHEHYSYLSLIAVKSVFEKYSLEIFDVDELTTHGGSLRIFAKHKENKDLSICERVQQVEEKERQFGLDSLECYDGFQQKVDTIKNDLLHFLLESRTANKKVICYGAAGKGNTLLNYCGIKGTDLISFVVDLSPFKQNKYLPGSHIPIFDEKFISEYKPDYVIILPWNLKDEIVQQLDYVKSWDCKFVVPIPKLQVF